MNTRSENIIKPLGSWRGIFALCIVCFHFGMHEFDEMAYSGVTFFFMLSGFLVTYHRSTLLSVKRFYKRRLLRIFPLHLLVLAAMIVLDLAIMRKFHYGWDLPLHVALLQSWIPNEQVFYNYRIHSWFLSSLLPCIAATPLLLKIIERVSHKLSWGIAIAACVAIVAINLVANEHWHSYIHVCPLTRLADYYLGMLLGASMRERSNSIKLSTATATIFEITVLAIFATLIALHASGNAIAMQVEQQALWWLPLALLIATSTALSGHEGLVGKLLSLRPLLWIGEISFEIYIMQKLVNNVFCYLLAPLSGHFGVMIYDYSFACTLPLLIITAWATHNILSKMTQR